MLAPAKQSDHTYFMQFVCACEFKGFLHMCGATNALLCHTEFSDSFTQLKQYQSIDNSSSADRPENASLTSCEHFENFIQSAKLFINAKNNLKWEVDCHCLGSLCAVAVVNGKYNAYTVQYSIWCVSTYIRTDKDVHWVLKYLLRYYFM